MTVRSRRLRNFIGVSVGVVLTLMSQTCARSSIPPAFIFQQQDLAVRVYCAHWRKTRRKQALEGEDVKRVLTDLEMLYPTAFSDCRSEGGQLCLGWLEALVRGLRRYDHLSLTVVCANPGPEDVLHPPGFKYDGDLRDNKIQSVTAGSHGLGHLQPCQGKRLVRGAALWRTTSMSSKRRR
jgi:hypothetical protein